MGVANPEGSLRESSDRKLRFWKINKRRSKPFRKVKWSKTFDGGRMEWKFVEEECHGFLDARDRHLVVHLFYSILFSALLGSSAHQPVV